VKGLLEHIESLKKAFAKLQPLSAENQQRLDKKFRLEWNYNSNHIEGNTLTYGETELLLIFGETKGNHEFREYEEMKGHDLALKLVEELAADAERNLTENFIRELNQAILKEPFYKEAITSDGQTTRRLIKIGEYKSFPNSVRLQNGEIFNYASPAETPALMNDLLNWYNTAAENKDQSPTEVAAEFHYRFVCIHPFDDGNGRISRLLMNYHLIKNGYPPVIIKTGDKKKYLFALHEADTGNLDAFKNYIAQQLVWSYEISIKAAKGENIDEVGDWEKKIKQLHTKLEKFTTIEKRKSSVSMIEAIYNIALPLFGFLMDKEFLLNSLFLDFQTNISMKSGNGVFKTIETLSSFFESYKNYPSSLSTDITEIDFDYVLIDFKKNGTNSFTLHNNLYFIFEPYSCKFIMMTMEKNPKQILLCEKLYHEPLDETDKENFLNVLTEYIIQQIEQKIKTPLA
jgi:Fic family protein